MTDGINGSAEAVAPVEPTLFRWFPELRARLPWVALTQVPTPVHRLDNLGSLLGMNELWIKRDDQCGLWYGGSKLRKLEFLLGDAIGRESRTVITFGALGSNHTLAAAICGRRLGLHAVLILVHQPVSDGVLQKLLLAQDQGAELVYARGRPGAVWAAVRRWLADTIRSRGRSPYVIPPGGSSPRGCLGYVNAALELAAQIRAGELSQPDYILVPVGSSGTMSGLEVGLRLAGLETRVVGVCVTDRLTVSARTVAMLANRCWSLLQRYVPSLPLCHVFPRQVMVWHEYLGKGYAYPTPGGQQAVRLMFDQEVIQLDEVYTGKTLAALIDAAKDPVFRERRILFWNTFNSLPLDGLLPHRYDYQRLPRRFHRSFEVERFPQPYSS